MLRSSKSKIKLIRKNIFNTNISDANMIYCYLIPTMMPKLAEKIKRECRPGTIVVSYMFSIPGLQVLKITQAGENNINFYTV
jgi:hypothetical protein